ncbi:MAG TPA: PIG-L family deacetylase, partial [Planctomycetota bacterium]|nr:PIG-L family deacetylase [Planctomycetota bacterium]
MRRFAPGDWAGRSVLLVAPHPDDEAFGCGGTAHLLAKAGARVQVVVAGSGHGGVGGAASPDEREDESRRACELLGTLPPVFLRLSSPTLRDDPAAAGRALAAAVGASPCALVLVPSPLERHRTHQATLLAALCAGLPGDGAWWGYGVWDALPAVDDVAEIDVTEARSAKTLAMSAYASQNRVRSLAAAMAARDMAQATFSRFTGDEPRRAVERLL